MTQAKALSAEEVASLVAGLEDWKRYIEEQPAHLNTGEGWKHYHELLSNALGHLQATSGWRGIAEAPKDGTDVLVARGNERYVVRWIKSEEVGPVWTTPDGHMIFRATHWQPLPSPPAPTGKE